MKPPMTPTPYEVVEAMVDLASPSGNDVLYDLGCGDGRIVIAAVQAGAGRAVGIDNDSKWIEIAQRNAQIAGVADQTLFLTQDIFASNISEANIVTVYTDAWTTLNLKSKLRTELAPGSRVISHSYGMCDWVPDHRVIVNGRALFLWVIRKQQSLETNNGLSYQRRNSLEVDSTPKRGVSIRLEWEKRYEDANTTANDRASFAESSRTPKLPLVRITNRDQHQIAAVVIRCRFEALGGGRTSTGRFSYLFRDNIPSLEARFPNIPNMTHKLWFISETDFILYHDKLSAFCMSRLTDDLWHTGLLSLEAVFFAIHVGTR